MGHIDRPGSQPVYTLFTVLNMLSDCNIVFEKITDQIFHFGTSWVNNCHEKCYDRKSLKEFFKFPLK